MKPLEGVKVVELATYLAAPSCARILADWGADVIKVEPPEGDVYRKLNTAQRIPSYDIGSPVYDNENANKRFLAINLKSAEGMATFKQLLGKADVFVTNNRPKALKKLGLSYEDLAPQFPSLVFADLLGYGEAGPDGEKPGFDYTTFYARTGMMGDLSPKGESIMTTIPGFGDHVAGAYLAGGIAAALLRRYKTGKGDRVDVGLYQTGIYTLSCGILAAYHGREFPKSHVDCNTSLSNTYKCSDGEWIYLAATDYNGQWKKVSTDVFGRPELAEDPMYYPVANAIKNLPVVVKTIDEIFMQHDSAYWVKKLKEHDIAHEKVAHFKDVPVDEQAWANNYIREVVYPGGQKCVFPNTPVTFASIGDFSFKIASSIGADSREILAELGFDKQKIEDMIAKGVVKIA